MAPTVEQEKNIRNGDVVAEHADEQYISTETSSSENNSDVQSFKKKVDKPRKTTCNLCHNFVGNSKMEYYNHLKTMHEASGKLLYCRLCPFIALYKHHLEYHFRKHNGFKPYKCDRCDYSCVNRSMLNSHYKSHSNIYQYSCKNCSYMTKYLHSLKMHLRKYSHEPGRTLNPDGSINSHSIIDVHGKRRGPKIKKRKSEIDLLQESGQSTNSTTSPSPPSATNQGPWGIENLYGRPEALSYSFNPGYSNYVQLSMNSLFPTQQTSPSAFIPRTFTKKDETIDEISISVDDDVPLDLSRSAPRPISTFGVWRPPLDLSLKQPSSPEMKSNGSSPVSSSPGTTESVSIVSSKFEDVVIRGANRRKGRAFKLNQYTVENDVDDLESESFPLKKTEITNIVPRMNFKPTLNPTKWNGFNSQQPSQPAFPFMNGMSYLIPNKFDHHETDDGILPAKIAWDLPTNSWCPFCLIDQGTACLLQIHSSFHSEKDPFTCAKCGLPCQTRTLFLAHVMSGSRINGRCINAVEYGPKTCNY